MGMTIENFMKLLCGAAFLPLCKVVSSCINTRDWRNSHRTQGARHPLFLRIPLAVTGRQRWIGSDSWVPGWPVRAAISNYVLSGLLRRKIVRHSDEETTERTIDAIIRNDRDSRKESIGCNGANA